MSIWMRIGMNWMNLNSETSHVHLYMYIIDGVLR